MALWDNDRFEKTARDLAKTWYGSRSANGASLTQLVTKTARDNELNPEQIVRLANVTNGHAFNEVFSAAKQAGEKERYPDFDIADAKTVIAALHRSAAEPVEKNASYPSLPDQLAEVRAIPDPLAERVKQASDRRLADRVDHALGSRQTPYEKFAELRDATEVLRTKRAGAEIRWSDAMDRLRAKMAELSFKHDDLEHDALLIHGHLCVPELNELRKTAGLRELPLDPSFYQAFQDRYLLKGAEGTDLLKQAVEARQQYSELRRAHETAVAATKEAEEAVRAA